MGRDEELIELPSGLKDGEAASVEKGRDTFPIPVRARVLWLQEESSYQRSAVSNNCRYPQQPTGALPPHAYASHVRDWSVSNDLNLY